MPGGNSHMMHIATIGMGLREFIVMMDRGTSKTYIEEVVLNSMSYKDDVTANCKFIEDDSLAEDLANFVFDKKILDMERIIGELTERGMHKWIGLP